MRNVAGKSIYFLKVVEKIKTHILCSRSIILYYIILYYIILYYIILYYIILYLLLFHYNNGFTNATQCYVTRTLPVLLNTDLAVHTTGL